MMITLPTEQENALEAIERARIEYEYYADLSYQAKMRGERKLAGVVNTARRWQWVMQVYQERAQ